MYDADAPDADDYMGYVEFDLAAVVNTFGHMLELDIVGGNPGGGRIIVRGTISKSA